MSGVDAGIDIGIPANKREEIVRRLSAVLGDTYTLYLKTHNYHWNVTGPMFQTLHLMFETEYNELALAVDEIAERIRALGAPAPGTLREFSSSRRLPRTPTRPTRRRWSGVSSPGRRPSSRPLAPRSPSPRRRTTSRRPICSHGGWRFTRRRRGC